MTNKEIRFEKVIEGIPIFGILIFLILCLGLGNLILQVGLSLGNSKDNLITIGIFGIFVCFVALMIYNIIEKRKVYYRRIK